MTSEPVVLVDDPEPGIRRITLNRPDRLNAITDELVTDLQAALRDADADTGVLAVVLTGAGRGFCAGFDLQSDTAADLADANGGPIRTLMAGQTRLARTASMIHGLRPVVVAAVNGPAAGGGLALALAADLRVAGPKATFVVANIKIGISGGEMGIAYFLPRLVGPTRAAEAMLTGRRIPADEADRWGLVNAVADDPVAAALELARSVTANAPFAVEQTKALIGLSLDASSLEQVIALENRTQVLASRSEDMAEAVTAWREGRAPRFGATSAERTARA